MTVGAVKWFDPALGYGYITPADGSPDIFVHFTALDRSGIKDLSQGQSVRAEPSHDGGVARATNLSVAAAA